MQMTDEEWTNHDPGRKGRWYAVPELGKEAQVFIDLKQREYKIFWVILWYKTKRMQDIFTKSWVKFDNPFPISCGQVE